MKWAAVVVAIVALACFDWTPNSNSRRDSPQTTNPYITLGLGAGTTHPGAIEPEDTRFRVVLYPYSVIPGGAEDVEELARAVARDPVVAEHYAGFDLAHAQLVRLSGDRRAYVSYRQGDHVFWTSRKLTLHKGETVITDGKHTARTRCGNLVTETAPGPPASPAEPAQEIFDRALALNPAVPDPDFEFPGPVNWLLPPKPGGLWGSYLPPPIVFGGAQPLSYPTLPSPEPRKVILVSSGLAALWALRRLSSGPIHRRLRGSEKSIR